MSKLKYLKTLLKFFGGIMAFILIFFFACVLYPYGYTPFPEFSSNAILIRGVNVVDVEADTILQNQDVLIADGKIESISKTSITVSKEAQVIQAHGKYLISSLWDMHVHVSRQSPYVDYPEFIRYGITHVRDMRGAYHSRDPFASVVDDVKEWNALVKSRELIGPYVHNYTSFAVNGTSAMFKN
jgi:hypothetical protein